MKYMTKEWYKTMQNTSFDLTLRITKNAEVFSEDYFRKLYKSEEKKWLREREEESNMKFEDFYPEELPEEYCQSLEPSDGYMMRFIREMTDLKFMFY